MPNSDILDHHSCKTFIKLERKALKPTKGGKSSIILCIYDPTDLTSHIILKRKLILYSAWVPKDKKIYH